MKLADGFEPAFVGTSISAHNRVQVAVYDYTTCIQVLTAHMSEEEAVEHFSYNVIGTWVGDDTPIFINVHPYDQLDEFLEED